MSLTRFCPSFAQVPPLHANGGHRSGRDHHHVTLDDHAPESELPPAGRAVELCANAGPAVRHQGSAQLRVECAHAVRKRRDGLRDGVPHCD